MITAPYNPELPHDEYLQKVVQGVIERTEKKDDDFLLGCVGPTGSGKTSLMFHAYTLYDKEGASIDYIPMNREDLAQALQRMRKKTGKRFCGFDEAMVTRRQAMSTFNVDVIALYMAIRGLNGFHWWNNPSAEMWDKTFVEEKLNGLIYIQNKGAVRTYLYFRKVDIQRFLAQNERITLPLLKKHGEAHAFYKGWFRKYNGRLWEEYLTRKKERMDTVVERFFEKYGGESNLSIAQFCQKYGQAKTSALRYFEQAKACFELKEGEDYVRKGLREVLTEKGSEKLLFCMQNPAYLREVRSFGHVDGVNNIPRGRKTTAL